MDIADRIKGVVAASGLTQKSFAERINVSAPFISQLCSGLSAPSDRTISDICREFGVNEIWLRTGAGEPYAPKTRAQAITEYLGKLVTGKRTETEMLLIELMSETSIDEWDALSDFFKRLAEKMNKPDTE